MESNFRQRLTADSRLLGTIVALSDPASIDTLSRVGYDWLWIDMEHAPLSIDQVRTMLAAKDPACPALVRVPNNDVTWIKRVLDIGPEGIIVPHVSSREEAERAVGAAKSPPTGYRSFGPGRASHYGIDSGYTARANQSTAVVVQIEHKSAVTNLADILDVEGIDGAVIGPFDLSGSYGKLGDFSDPEVQDAIELIRTTCKEKSIASGIFCLTE
ncbi:MAG TPA: aldolase/citrate lyase family protein, partial [Chroococcales cyanobacterium]